MRSSAAIVLLFALVACHRPPPGPPAVAVVDGKPVLVSDLKAELARIQRESDEQTVLDPAKRRALHLAVLNDLIDRRLLLAQAEREKIAVTDHEVDEALTRSRKVGEAVAAKAALPPPSKDLRQRTRDELAIDKLLLREVEARVALGPDDAKKYYDAHPEEQRHPEEVRVSQIVVMKRSPVDLQAKKQADALRVMLNRTDFATLARTQSGGPERSRSGDLGWFSRGMMPPQFNVCFQMRKGQISDVIETPYGFHIFKLVDRRDAGPVPFDQVQKSIELKLKLEATEKEQSAYIEKLRRKAGVRIFEKELARLM